MADNVTADPGTGGAVFATDDIGGVHYPITKITLGALDAQTLLSGGNGATDAGTVRVTIASDTTGVLSVDDNGGSLTVDATALDIRAITNADVVTAELSATDNAVLDTIATPVATISATPLQRVAIFDASDTQITSFGGGTQYAVDDALGATPTGTLAVGIRDDALSTLTPVEGDAVGLRVDANGALWIASSGTTVVSGTITANAGTGTFTVDGSGVTQPISAASLPLPTGAATEATLATIDVDTGNIAAGYAAEGAALGSGVLIQGDDGTDRTNVLVDTDGHLQVDVLSGGGGGTANTISTNNSTTTPLGISGNFTGTGDDVSAYSAVSIQLDSDQDSATDGMKFEFSSDNTNWDDVYSFTYTASQGARRFQFPVTAQYFRVNYTNGGTGQTHFRVQTILHSEPIRTSIHRVEDDVSPDRSVELVKSVLAAQVNGSGDFVAIQSSAGGVLKVGGSVEVDTWSAGTLTVTATALDIRALTNTDVVTAELSATDNAVLDAIEANTDYGAVQGGGTEATALRVTIANDSTGVLSIDDNGASLTVDATALDIRALTNTDVVTAELSATDNAVLDSIDTNTTGLNTTVGTDGAAGPAGALSVGGTEAGGNFQEVRVDTDGHLQVDVLSGGGSGPTDTDDDAVAAGQSPALNIAMAYMYDGTDWSRAASGTGVRTLQTQRVTIATDDIVPASQSGTWNITNVSGTVSLPTGAATESTLSTIDADTSILSAAIQTDDAAYTTGTDTGMPMMGYYSLSPDTVDTGDVGVLAMTNTRSLLVQGDGSMAVQEDGLALTALQDIQNCVVGPDNALSTSETIIQGLAARSAEPTAVANNDAVRALATLLGKQVTYPYAIPPSTWSYATATLGVTDTADDAAKAAAGAGIRNYVTSVQVINGHATVATEVVIKDGSTVLWRGWAEAVGGGVSAKFDPPLRGTANTAVNVANITTGSKTYFNLQGFEAAE